MNIQAKYGVHFYSMDEASIEFSMKGGEDEKFGELLAFSLFALRMLVNLGKSHASEALGHALLIGGKSDEKTSRHATVAAPRVLEWQGASGPKRFLASLEFGDNSFHYNVKAKGFGILARGVGYYAPQAVLLLLDYFAAQRSGDRGYVKALGYAARRCWGAFSVGGVTIASQAEAATDIATRAVEIAYTQRGETPEHPSDVEARPIQESSDDVEELLRRFGASLNAEDIVDTIASMPSELSFDNLDRATRMVFQRLVEEQAKIFRSACPVSAYLDENALFLEIGKSIYDGYAIGRRLLGTHATRLSVSDGGEENAQTTGQQMLKKLEQVKPADLLRAAGWSDFMLKWAEHYSEEGIHAGLPDRKDAPLVLWVTVLNGFALAVAEHETASPTRRAGS